MSSPIMSLMRGAFTSPFKRAGRSGTVLPAQHPVRRVVRVAPGALASYNTICGFSTPGVLPLTYPHVLGFAAALRVLTGPAFPLPVAGLVHTWIEITGHRLLRATDVLELTVYATSLTPHRRGTEVTMVTEARLAGELVWESRSGYLSRHKRSGKDAANATGTDSATPTVPAADVLPAAAEWILPGDLGRRYGAASGDRNPIHLYPLTAQLFGFPRAIAHGMWTVARCLAEAEAGGEGAEADGNGDAAGMAQAGIPGRIREVRADFKTPVLLPATVTYAADSTGSAFQVHDGSRIHLTGTLTRDT